MLTLHLLHGRRNEGSRLGRISMNHPHLVCNSRVFDFYVYWVICKERNHLESTSKPFVSCFYMCGSHACDTPVFSAISMSQ